MTDFSEFKNEITSVHGKYANALSQKVQDLIASYKKIMIKILKNADFKSLFKQQLNEYPDIERSNLCLTLLIQFVNGPLCKWYDCYYEVDRSLKMKIVNSIDYKSVSELDKEVANCLTLMELKEAKVSVRICDFSKNKAVFAVEDYEQRNSFDLYSLHIVRKITGQDLKSNYMYPVFFEDFTEVYELASKL